MVEKKDKTAGPSLDAAYGLETPEDSAQLYGDWADTYDSDFATAEDYRLHIHVAEAFRDAGGQGPVLDVGAGTGLCGQVLAAMDLGPVDGIDISPQMLAQAETKGVYRSLSVADLYDGPHGPSASYSGIVSSGTFTNGHVGPEVLPDLLQVARPGAVVALSINARHYAAKGFEAMLARLASDRITGLRLPEVRIYGDRASGAHANDLALIALFEMR